METKAYLHQIHPVLLVRDVIEALDFYFNRLGFKIAFTDDEKNPKYAGFYVMRLKYICNGTMLRNGR